MKKSSRSAKNLHELPGKLPLTAPLTCRLVFVFFRVVCTVFIRDVQKALPIRSSLSSFPQAVVQAVPTPCRCLNFVYCFSFPPSLAPALSPCLSLHCHCQSSCISCPFLCFSYNCPLSSLLAVDFLLSTARLLLELDSVHIGGGALLRGWFFVVRHPGLAVASWSACD